MFRPFRHLNKGYNMRIANQISNDSAHEKSIALNLLLSTNKNAINSEKTLAAAGQIAQKAVDGLPGTRAGNCR
jgi:hypothetical protein